MMAKMQARASVISQIAGISPADARKIWHEEMGRSSPSGQQPHDQAWYLKKTDRRYHSALIIMLAHRARQSMPEYAAFPYAYYHYARISAGTVPRSRWHGDPAFRISEDDYTIPFARAHYLCQIYSDDVFENGRRMCELQIKRCIKCGGLYLSHINEPGKKCPMCIDKRP